jgi:PAS domain S-box-containing protein
MLPLKIKFKHMKLSNYENALAKHYNSLSLNSFPLTCWDFYLNSFDRLKILNKIVKENNWNTTWDYKEELESETVIVVTDAKLSIVFASKNIVIMNGYYPNEVVGNSPKMFQGEHTNKKISKEISEAIKTQQPFDKVIWNYCKDGSLYKCHIKGFPVFDKKGKLANFIAFEKIAA